MASGRGRGGGGLDVRHTRRVCRSSMLAGIDVGIALASGRRGGTRLLRRLAVTDGLGKGHGQGGLWGGRSRVARLPHSDASVTSQGYRVSEGSEYPLQNGGEAGSRLLWVWWGNRCLEGFRLDWLPWRGGGTPDVAVGVVWSSVRRVSPWGDNVCRGGGAIQGVGVSARGYAHGSAS
jgi:hypothetical protein